MDKAFGIIIDSDYPPEIYEIIGIGDDIYILQNSDTKKIEIVEYSKVWRLV